MIERISNYIERAKFDMNNELEVSFLHKDLGKIDLLVRQIENSPELSLDIKAHEGDGVSFFKEHESQLMATLQRKGISLDSLNIIETKSYSDFVKVQEKDMSSSNFQREGEDRAFERDQSQREGFAQDQRKKRNFQETYQQTS